MFRMSLTHKAGKEMMILIPGTQVSFREETLLCGTIPQGAPLGECETLRVWPVRR